MSPAIGSPIDRVDGPEKVTGRARYAAEILLPNTVYAAVVGATVPSGRVSAIDTSRVGRGGGCPRDPHPREPGQDCVQPPLLPSLVGGPAPGMTFFPMQDDVIHYAGQPVALVVADSYERRAARRLARRNRVRALGVGDVDR